MIEMREKTGKSSVLG